MASRLLTLAECAERLGVSRATAFRLAANKQIRTLVIGERSRRVSEESLEAYIRDREQEAQAAAS